MTVHPSESATQQVSTVSVLSCSVYTRTVAASAGRESTARPIHSRNKVRAQARQVLHSVRSSTGKAENRVRVWARGYARTQKRMLKQTRLATYEPSTFAIKVLSISSCRSAGHFFILGSLFNCSRICSWMSFAGVESFTLIAAVASGPIKSRNC
jgi:hypothetical protein